MSREIRSVSFIGSGNVAYGLGMALKKVVTVNRVWSRNHENAFDLARRLSCTAVDSIDQVIDSDLLIVAVTDQAIEKLGEQIGEALKAFKKPFPIIVHTSGNVSIGSLNPGGLNIDFGVLYPLQTFTYGRRVSLKSVPFFINGNSESTISKLVALTEKISTEAHFMNDKDRRKLHLPAVLVNNFVNHLIYLGEQVALDDGVKIDYFIPLIEETVKKIKTIGAYMAQTGPARRNDVEIMDMQLKRLNQRPELKEIYQLLSNSIKSTYHEDRRRD